MVVAQLTCVCGGAALVRLVSPPSKMLIFAESGINRSSTVVSSWIPLIVCHCRPLILSATCEFQCGVANRTLDEFRTLQSTSTYVSIRVTIHSWEERTDVWDTLCPIFIMSHHGADSRKTAASIVLS